MALPDQADQLPPARPARHSAMVVAAVLAVMTAAAWLWGHRLIDWTVAWGGSPASTGSDTSEVYRRFERMLPWLTVGTVSVTALSLAYARGGLPLLARSLVAFLAMGLAATAIYWSRVSRFVLSFPFELEYGEGPVAAQVSSLMNGVPLYGPITDAPFTVSNYPPVYLVTAAAGAGMFGLTPLMAGRLVSIASGAAIAVLAAAIVAAATRDLTSTRMRLLAVLAAVTAVVTNGYLLRWSVVARVDALALALSLAGFLLLLRFAGRTSWGFLVGVALLTLAAFTRQSSIAAAMAIVMVTAGRGRRPALRTAIALAAAGLGGLLILTAATGGRFLQHVVWATAHEFSRSRAALEVLHVLATQPILVLLGLAGAIWLLRASWRDRRTIIATETTRDVGEGFSAGDVRSGIGWLVVFSFAVLWTVGKVGSSSNYYIEFLAACCLVLGVAVGHACNSGQARARGGVALTALGLMIAQLLWSWAGLAGRSGLWRSDPTERQALASVVNIIGATEGPVISEDMVALVEAGRGIEFQPFAMTQLHYQGKWDEGPVRDAVRAGRYNLVVLRHDAAALRQVDGHRFSAAMRSAVADRYCLMDVVHPSEQRAAYWIYRPETAPCR